MPLPPRSAFFLRDLPASYYLDLENVWYNSSFIGIPSCNKHALKEWQRGESQTDGVQRGGRGQAGPETFEGRKQLLPLCNAARARSPCSHLSFLHSPSIRIFPNPISPPRITNYSLHPSIHHISMHRECHVRASNHHQFFCLLGEPRLLHSTCRFYSLANLLFQFPSLPNTVLLPNLQALHMLPLHLSHKAKT